MAQKTFQLNSIEKTALDVLISAGFDAYAVGGCVRDRAMGLPPKDTDITTSATPDEIKAAFSHFKTVDTGIAHGTVTVIIDKTPLEITTFRVDGKYSDNRHPDSVNFTRNLSDDLCRRDFTINAMAYNDTCGLVDLFGGIKDIENKIIRCVGDAKTRFCEDALRIMRAARFCATLQFEIEEKTAKAMEECADLLKNVSAERKFAELKKLLCGKWAGKVILAFPRVFNALIPELTPCRNFEQHSIYHKYDVLTHITKVIDNIKCEPHLKLAALLHDIKKPACCTKDVDGTWHYKGHPLAGAAAAEEILKNFKSDNFTKNRVTLLIAHHDENLIPDKAFIGNCIKKLGKDVFFELIELQLADNLSKGTVYGEKSVKSIREVKALAEEMINSGAVFTVSELNINGNDLIENNIKGKAIGKTLDYLLCAVIEEKVKNKKDALLNYLKNGEPDD